MFNFENGPDIEAVSNVSEFLRNTLNMSYILNFVAEIFLILTYDLD
jgi:hypothetical protein